MGTRPPIGRQSSTTNDRAPTTHRTVIGMFNRFILLAAGAVIGTSWAQAPSDAPAGTTGLCKDGSYSSEPTKRGACSGHQGVQSWYGKVTADAPATVPKPANPSSDGPAAPARPAPFTNAATPDAPATTPKIAPPAGQRNQTPPGSAGASAPSVGSPAAPATVPKVATSSTASGGPGVVWVNSQTKVYHCQGDRWYGKTTQGSYMSESDAVAQGDHADRGKACH